MLKATFLKEHWQVLGLLGEPLTLQEFQSSVVDVLKEHQDNGDPTYLLIVAEFCRKWNLGQTAAQIYFHILPKCHISKSSTFDWLCEASFCLSRLHDSAEPVQSYPDLAIYCVQQIKSALMKDGFTDLEIQAWIRDALRATQGTNISARQGRFSVHQIKSSFVGIFTTGGEKTRSALPAFGTYAELAGSMQEIKAEMVSGYAPSLSLFTSYFQDLVFILQSQTQEVPKKSTRSKLYWGSFLLLIALALFASLQQAQPIDFVHKMRMLSGGNLFSSLLLLWPVLLILSWIYLKISAGHHAVKNFVSPLNFMRDKRIVVGEIIAFDKDWFFHIFQFIWLPFLFIVLLTFNTFEGLPEFLTSVWTSTGAEGTSNQEYLKGLETAKQSVDVSLDTVWRSLRNLILSNIFAYCVSGIAAISFLFIQFKIQKNRAQSGENFYWWDIRVCCSAWIVRWLMVGIDTFFYVFLIVKLTAAVIVTFELTLLNTISIDTLNPDGVGGMAFIQGMVSHFFYMALLFGCFVMASVFLHKNLGEYRNTDRLLLGVYFVMVGLFLTPLIVLEISLKQAHEKLLSHIEPILTNAPPILNAGFLEKVKTLTMLRQWEISALGLDAMNIPVILVILQSGFVIWRAFGKGGTPVQVRNEISMAAEG